MPPPPRKIPSREQRSLRPAQKRNTRGNRIITDTRSLEDEMTEALHYSLTDLIQVGVMHCGDRVLEGRQALLPDFRALSRMDGWLWVLHPADELRRRSGE